MKIEQVEFTQAEAKKVDDVLCNFAEMFCDFAKKTNLPANEANLLLQGAMMAFSSFSCVESISTVLICQILMHRIYGTKEE